MTEIDVVTGAFGYTGRYISTRLLAAGRTVRTLTNHPLTDDPLSDVIEAHPFNFDKPELLVESLQGVTTLYNTYWVRYAVAGTPHALAVRNTRILLAAAKEAGVERLVHVSITNPDANSFYAYYRGKAAVEEAVRQSGLSYAIVRPTVLFGGRDILINDLTWLIRRFPVFTVPGDGQYRMRPVYAGDLAELMVRMGAARENVVIDAVGPESYPFIDLVRLIARTVGTRTLILKAPPGLVERLLPILNLVTNDVVLTRDEIDGLMAGYVDSQEPTTGQTRLSDYLRTQKREVGRQYQKEITRRRT